MEKGVHIEGQIVEFASVVGNRVVDVGHKLHDRVYPLPHIGIRGVEDVWTVAMNCNTVAIFAVEVTARMATAVNDKHALARLYGAISDHRAEEPRANDKDIVGFAILTAAHSLGMKLGKQGALKDG